MFLVMAFTGYYSISGLVADVDIESEKYRWMGSARLDFYVSKPFMLFMTY